MVVESSKNLVPKFFSKTATTYNKVVVCATFGKDRFWKNQILKQITSGRSFLDLACGTGILTRKIAAKFPAAQVTGIDVSPSYLEVAKQHSTECKNIVYVYQDAEQLNLDSKFDCIVSSYIPKYCNPDLLIKACLNHLKSGGKIVLHDFTYPTNKMVRMLWNSYFVLLRIAGFFIPSWNFAFLDLPKLIRTSAWLTEYNQVMQNYGLDTKEMHLTWDCAAVLVGTR